MPATAECMYLLQYGAERVNKGVSLRGGGSRLLWEPLIGIVLGTSEGWVLMETGLGRRAIEDPVAQGAYVHSAESFGTGPEELVPQAHFSPLPPTGVPWTWGYGGDGDPMLAALAAVDLTLEDITLAVLSHLHLDHSGGLRTLADANIPIVVQQRELDFALSDRAEVDDGYYKPDYVDVSVEWRPIDGDAELAPGLHALFTPGHTPGNMSYVVDLPESGSWVFAVDAADLGENLHDLVPPGSCSGGTEADERDAEISLERVLEEARRRDARLVPGHDQLIWTAVRHPRGGHR